MPPARAHEVVGCPYRRERVPWWAGADLPADTPQDFVVFTALCLKKDKTTRPTAAELLHSEPMLTWARRLKEGASDRDGAASRRAAPAAAVDETTAALEATSMGAAPPQLADTTTAAIAPADAGAALAATSAASGGGMGEAGSETSLSLEFTRAAIPAGLRQLFQWRTHWQSAGGGSASAPIWQSVDALVGQEVVAMSAGPHATAMVSAAGEVYGWRSPGSEIEAAFATHSRPTRLSAASSVHAADAAMGDEVLLLLDADGQLWRWLAAHPAPAPVAGLPSGVRVMGLGCGSEHCVACTEDGRVFSWGANDEGQLGLGDSDERRAPCVVELPDGEVARAVSCAGESTFVLTVSGSALSCGSDDFRQLGLPPVREYASNEEEDEANDEVDSSTLRWMAMPKSVQQKLVQISAAAQHGAALTSDGRVVTWGHFEGGRLGRKRTRGASDASYARPATVAIPVAGQNVVTVSAGGAHTVAVSTSGALWLWGRARMPT